METYSRDGLVFDVRDSRDSDRGGGLARDDESRAGDGPPVVLLHGFPQDSSAWRGVSDRLVAAGYRTLAPDQRGYSPGARPIEQGAYNCRETAADVIGLLDAAGIGRAHLVGHDWGGSAAWAVASNWPDRVASLTVLSTPHPGAIREVALTSTQGPRLFYMAVFNVPGLAKRLLDPGSGPRGTRAWQGLLRGLPRGQKQVYTARMSEPGALTAALNWYRALPGDLARPSMVLHRIDVPTLYLWGGRDPVLSRAAALATAKFVTGPYTFTILPTAGHWLPEARPDDVCAALLEHLAAHPD